MKVELPAPQGGGVDVLVVAAEHSGDEHAGRMVRELRERVPGVRVAALGGPRLEAAGAQLLMDLTKSSAMGFAVVAKVSFYRALIASVAEWVERFRPRVVCFVDSSGLNLRIAKQLFARGVAAKAGGATRLVYYISPQVWASRAKRRFAMAQHLDGLAAIFPFEREVYADTALPVEFVGHPFLAADYVAPVRHDPTGPVLLLPGSRRALVRRLFPVLREAFAEFARGRSGERAVVLYPSEEIRAEVAALGVPANVELRSVGGEAVGASAVLTTSGTMSMHCALAGIPGAVAYRTDALTYALGRMLVRVKFIGIANVLLGEAMYPEYIQKAATPAALAAELRACRSDEARRTRTAVQAARLRELLRGAANATAGEWLARQLAGGDSVQPRMDANRRE